MENINVSPLKKREIDQMTKLYTISLRDNHKGFIQDIDFRENIEMMMRDFRANIGDIYSLKKDNEVIGMGALKRVNETTVEMCKLHLYPRFKGQGLGKKLALSLIKYAKDLGYSKINLHVTKTQKEAIGLYAKLGFTEYQQKLCKVEQNGKTLKFDTLYMERVVEYDELVECV